MDSQELLAQLADIHLPEPVSFWPPAPGWWILAAMILALVIWGTLKLVAASQFRKIRDHALAELDKCYQAYATSTESDKNAMQLHFVNSANSVFKRVALYHFGGSEIASLGGSQWVDFMKRVGNASLMDDQISEALSQGRFKTTIDVDVDNFYSFGKLWISSLYLSKSPTMSTDKQPATTASEVSQ